MKKTVWITGMMMIITMPPFERSEAQIPVVGLFTSAIKKVITAIDLKVQQLQNQTITLQNAEQQLENSLSLGKLNDISGWLGKEKVLYQNYYRELAQIKVIISDYDEVKKIIVQQKQLLSEYQQANALFHQDKHFSAEELSYMSNVYDGILQESLRNLNDVMMAVNAFSTQMDDAERMLRIHKVSSGMQTNLDHLRQFNQQNVTMSLARAKDEQDRRSVRQLYGLQ
ncbi:conjugal transfer protein TraI [Mucilaginibacter sp. SP1R1]|uniref:conjugal transfer protein TraI n=1 Tax=Mucilaginibacter sp. SP1R1 TaxID=2723091 RepID=UPI001831914D|nr:conjugal transfer protein TraI [Mucilaginibacter sp. SP1R1]MBB6150708.1 C-terminal processing protease CtpA/Prc [Mucilaginibacter sp. SP1R1]